MAKKQATDPKAKDAYYATMQQSKLAAGIRLEDAIAITNRQRAEDDANPEFAIPGTAAAEESPE